MKNLVIFIESMRQSDNVSKTESMKQQSLILGAGSPSIWARSAAERTFFFPPFTYSGAATLHFDDESSTDPKRILLLKPRFYECGVNLFLTQNFYILEIF